MKRKPIDKQLLKKWKVIMFDITLDDVKAGTGLSKPTIREALNNGKATQSTIDCMTQYFNSFQAA